jgi:hypothetical protein
MSDKYILNGHNAIPEPDLMKWGEWFESNKDKKMVARSEFGDIFVSTVFLGLDHSFGNGPPLLFETMVFGGALDQEMNRCETWEQAEKMHETMVKKVRNQL